MPLTESQAQRIVDTLYQEDELYGCIVGFEGYGQSRVLSAGYSPSVNFTRVVVVVSVGPPPIDTSMAPPADAQSSPQPAVVRQPQVQNANRDRITAELAGAGLSCGMAALSGLAIAGGVAAEVPSGGTSTFIVVMAWTGFVTSGMQCVNGIVRSAEAITNPDGDSLHRWDQNTIYSYGSLIVDGLGLASGVATLPLRARFLWTVLRRRSSLMTFDEFAQLPRHGRQDAVRRALEEASRTDAGRREVIRAMREAGLNNQQVRNMYNYGATTGRRGEMVLDALSEAATTRVNARLGHLLSDSRDLALGLGISATSPEQSGSASGAANALIVHVSERE